MNYIQNKVGGWVTTAISNVAEVNLGKTPSKNQYCNSGTHKIIKFRDVSYEGIDWANNEKGFVIDEAVGELRELKINDVLITASAHASEHIGKKLTFVSSLPKKYKRIFYVGELLNIRSNQQVILPKFLSYFFLSRDGYRKIQSHVKGVHLTSGEARKMEVPVSPLAEQHRIVAKVEELFSELDQGIASLKTAREQIKVYRQALLKHAFEGKLTAAWREQNRDKLEPAAVLQVRIQTERETRYHQQLKDWEANGKQGGKPKAPKPLPPLTAKELAELPELPKGWGWVKIGSVAKVGTGATPLKSRSDYYNGGNIPWVTSGALNDNFVTGASDYVTGFALKETNLQLYPKHTLLIAMYGEGKTRGKCSELLIEATTNQAIAAIVQEGMSAELRKYMKWFFQKNYGDIRLKSSGGVQPNLNLGIVENTPFPMCAAEEARQIVSTIESKLSEADQLDQTITISLQQAEALRQSILKRAFSGRLVPQDPNDEPAAVLLARIKAEREAQPKARKPRGAK